MICSLLCKSKNIPPSGDLLEIWTNWKLKWHERWWPLVIHLDRPTLIHTQTHLLVGPTHLHINRNLPARSQARAGWVEGPPKPNGKLLPHLVILVQIVVVILRPFGEIVEYATNIPSRLIYPSNTEVLDTFVTPVGWDIKKENIALYAFRSIMMPIQTTNNGNNALLVRIGRTRYMRNSGWLDLMSRLAWSVLDTSLRKEHSMLMNAQSVPRRPHNEGFQTFKFGFE